MKRSIILFFLIFLFYGIASFTGVSVHGSNGPPGNLPQQDTPYNFPTEESTIIPYYPFDTSSPTSTSGLPPSATASLLPGTPSPSPKGIVSATPTSRYSLTPSDTPGRNLFGTEDAEMGSARISPPPSETPEPTETLTPTITQTPTREEKSGFQFNQGWFVAGILVPLLIGLVILFLARTRQSGEFR